MNGENSLLIIRVRKAVDVTRTVTGSGQGIASIACGKREASYPGIALTMPVHTVLRRAQLQPCRQAAGNLLRFSAGGTLSLDVSGRRASGPRRQLPYPVGIEMFGIHFVGLSDVIRQPILEKLQHGDRIAQPARLQVILELLDLSDEFLML